MSKLRRKSGKISNPDEIKMNLILSEIRSLKKLDFADLVVSINCIREEIHKISPFKHEPVDFVRWVLSPSVVANDYNPNSVAPTEMKLLEHSIREDGYTQPIVSWRRDDLMFEVVDGFHRNKVGKESKTISKRIKGYLPLVVINDARKNKGDRVSSTIRHNRARGKHRVDSMSEIIIDLKKRNWSDEKIGRELGMDPDEVLRLAQITGLAEMFKDREFSSSWTIGCIDENDTLNDQLDNIK